MILALLGLARAALAAECTGDLLIVLVDPLQAERERAETGVALLPPPGSGGGGGGGGAAAGGGYLTGLLVTQTLAGLPAEAAGLREGDVVLEINGMRMKSKGAYFAALGPVYEKDKRLQCRVWRPAGRGGGGHMLDVTLTPKPREESSRRARRILW